MQRSKQQALMFLLGATLVGGVLGFSAERVIRSNKPGVRVSARVQMYKDIGVDSVQQIGLDSVLDETNCKIGVIMRSVRPSIDSVRVEGLNTFVGMLTAEQRSAYELREKVTKARNDSLEKERDAKWAKEHPGQDRQRRCGGARPGQNQSGALKTGPGGPATPERRPAGSLFY